MKTGQVKSKPLKIMNLFQNPSLIYLKKMNEIPFLIYLKYLDL